MPHYLIAQSELPDERQARRQRAGKSSGETYAATLKQMQPGVETSIVSPADDDGAMPSVERLAAFDAIFLTGSPMHVYDDGPEVRRQLDFMTRVFAAGVPSFGSCAGLQIAVAAAGGRVRKMPERMEAGIARRISATQAGRAHPLLAGRPASWDAPAVHGDEVLELPPGATLLASNAVTQVQAAEIRFDRGVFWGVQYHPELALREIAIAIAAQAADLVAVGLAEQEDQVRARAAEIDALHDAPDSRALRWRLGVDGEFAEEGLRRREIANFLDNLPGLRG
ncbi:MULTISPECIES: type 1 glutamine amidotransferase [unclassified Sphingomonas]|uniref:type 1 glutamine amidotransferase n=1 Tax=unclassified Sphingomonas TaxID=196159 RepID=UPI00286432B1|nr:MULTISPECIES: type 1 glutamine amidotransferase [unclassified Sphingomonas]MDR6114717.1 GMP synthase-like glutamine amidotransferase [Sphingomonas sp. SORGH_AS_0789]MDR6151610.1 GMP synthase-like glutamine amidotransferase [Sphingomonas sp. SORGH_AS_0742]